ncbi:hypothetical protein [Nocardiopsis synnemataformans]|uniref:hypothetical protein n=1 Tax=Nocardiopsis synnemataformans TaxID=61305 RepID=UPI003EB786BF
MTGESVESCVTGGLINPATFPVPDIHPGQLEYRAGRLRARAADVSQAGSDIKSSWAGLSSCYSSPEAETLYAVVDPVAADGESVATGADKAATALETFAEEVRGIKERWAALTADANAFLASIEGDDDWQKGGWFGGESEKVEEHNLLLARIDPLRRAYETAEIECANAINADLAVRTNFVHGGEGVEAGVHEYVHGYDEDLSEFDLPWGGPMDTDERWTVDAAHAVGDFFTGIAEDVGGFVGVHSSEGWFETSWGDALSEYHYGNITGFAALVGLYNLKTQNWEEVGWKTYGDTWKEVAHSVVPWTEWEERPGYVITTAVLNVGSEALNPGKRGGAAGFVAFLWSTGSSLNKVDFDHPSSHQDGDGSSSGRIDPELGHSLPSPSGIDLANLENFLSPSEMAELRDALDRLEQANDERNDGSDSPTAPTTQDLHDGLTVENALNQDPAEADGNGSTGDERPMTVEAFRNHSWGDRSDPANQQAFFDDLQRLLNERKPGQEGAYNDFYREFYKENNGHRRNAETLVGKEGWGLPKIARAGNGDWIPLEGAEPPAYLGDRTELRLDDPDFMPERTDNPTGDQLAEIERRERLRADLAGLDSLAEKRRAAINASASARNHLEEMEKEHGEYKENRKDNHKLVNEAKDAYKKEQNKATELSERFGEETARTGARFEFDGSVIEGNDGGPLMRHVVDQLGNTVYDENGEPELTELRPDLEGAKEIDPSPFAPKGGQDQFDQIYRTVDGDIVIVEAKSSTRTTLGERVATPDNEDPRLVSQGTRAYLVDILRAMSERGKQPENSAKLKLAGEIQARLRQGRVTYSVFKGNPVDIYTRDVNGDRQWTGESTANGYDHRIFDLSEKKAS